MGASLCQFEVTGTDAASTNSAAIEASFGEEVQVQDAQYTYNHLGQRSSKTRMVGGVETTTYYIYDQNGQMLGEYSSTGATIREYVYLEGKLLAQYDYSASATEPTTNYYINDHLGTPMLMMNREPEQTYDLETGPFGERYGEFKVAGLTQNIRFPGQYADGESGYSQNWNRDYDSATGRYLQSDPIGLAGGINTFAYVAGNPVNYVDRRGLDDPGCDVLFGESISNACVLEACARHDKSFFENGCNWTTWINPFASSACHMANATVVIDILGCIGNNQDDPNKENYFYKPPKPPLPPVLPPSGGNTGGGVGGGMCPIDEAPEPQPEPDCWSGHSGNTAWGGCMHTSGT